MLRQITLVDINRSQKQLSFRFSVDGFIFNTSYWYDSVDFFELESRFGEQYMEKVYFHIAAFEANKYASLHVETISWGPYQRHFTPAFEVFWREILLNVWAQWRYENNKPEYQGPVCIDSASTDSISPVQNPAGEVDVLSFCGGGKDSLVSMRLLQNAGISYDTLAYSSSIYGAQSEQHRLIAGLIEHANPVNTRKQWVYDDFLDSPVLELASEIDSKTLTAAETPSSIFAAIPYVLQHGYKYVALGHERSADTGQVIWDKTGEDVNHQWGKSHEAEVLINTYIGKQLVSNFQYFSILKPIYDVVIFNLLPQSGAAIHATHSCNIKKPWCGRCPKCLYVFANYMAYLDADMVLQLFDENLFDVAENIETYRSLLGLTDQLPFECIGHSDESRLAFELCKKKGVKGAAIDVYDSALASLNVPELLEKYLQVDENSGSIPDEYAELLLSQMKEAARSANKVFSSVGLIATNPEVQ